MVLFSVVLVPCLLVLFSLVGTIRLVIPVLLASHKVALTYLILSIPIVLLDLLLSCFELTGVVLSIICTFYANLKIGFKISILE